MKWLPLIVGIVFALLGHTLTGSVPPWLSATLIFYAPCLGLAISLARRSSEPMRGDASAGSRNSALHASLLAFVFFWAAGVYVTKTIGEHSGDEGHYLVQAESLWRDGDLDIRNNLGREVTEDERDHFHVSAYARDGHWYSWHPYGLSLLLAPTVPLGIVARHAVLALIAAMGIFLMIDLSRRYGARTWSSLAWVGLVGLSLPYVVYAVRCLPEMLGAVLLLSIAWSTEAQDDRPRLAPVVAGLATAFLPFVHTRFAPIGAAALALSCALLLLRTDQWRLALVPIMVRCAIAAVGLLVYLAMQFRMFDGGLSYPLKDALLSYPPGIWYAVASDRGLLYTLPSTAVFLTAPLVLAARSPSHRGVSMNAMLLAALVLITSCGNIWFHGGMCLPGRYALVMIPMLVPLAIVALDRATPTARIWTCILSLVSVGYTALTLVNLQDLGNQFALMPTLLGLHVAALRDLPTPFLPPLPGSVHVTGILLIGISALLLTPLARRLWLVVAVLMLFLASAAGTSAKRAEIWHAYFGPQIEEQTNHE